MSGRDGGADVPVNDGAKKPLTLARVYEVLNARFITSNGIPVERATIRADEWKLIQPILRAARNATVTPIDCAAVEELVRAVKNERAIRAHRTGWTTAERWGYAELLGLPSSANRNAIEERASANVAAALAAFRSTP